MIKSVKIRVIKNSRKEDTIEVALKTGSGVFRSSAPSGKSKSSYEAKDIGISALEHFAEVKREIIGLEESPMFVDNILEALGGDGFERIGGNLSIAVSMAVLKAAAKGKVYKRLNPKAATLPLPLGNAIGGGAHRGGTAIQEFLVFPKNPKTMKEAIESNALAWKLAGKNLKRSVALTGRNDENAWTSKLDDIKTLEFIRKIADETNSSIGLDFAASQLYKNGEYSYGSKTVRVEEQIDFVKEIIQTYNVSYVEDPFHENDFQSFSELSRKVKCIICGDDLYATNRERLAKGIEMQATNAIIIKPNQAGTVSRALEVAELAKKNKIMPVASHRSGETKDSFIADLAVGIGAPLIKCGIYGKERTAKLDRLKEIWKELKKPKMAKV